MTCERFDDYDSITGQQDGHRRVKYAYTVIRANTTIRPPLRIVYNTPFYLIQYFICIMYCPTLTATLRGVEVDTTAGNLGAARSGHPLIFIDGLPVAPARHSLRLWFFRDLCSARPNTRSQ